MTSKDTSLLVEAAISGDKTAFSRLFEIHYSTVYGLTLSTVKDPTVAEDITQETFLIAWRRLGDLRQSHAFRTWLRKIARNLSLNWLTSASYRRSLLEHVAVSNACTEPSGLDPVLRTQQRERLESVRDALDFLKPKIRVAIILFYLEGQSVVDAAESLGISEGAMKMRLLRGRSLLRTHFESHLEEDLSEELFDRPLKTVRSRIATYMAVGPALPVKSRFASNAGFGFSPDPLKHEGLRGFWNLMFKGRILMLSAKKAAVSTAILALATGAFLYFQDSPSFSHETRESQSNIESSAQTLRSGRDEFIDPAEPIGHEDSFEHLASAPDSGGPDAVLTRSGAGINRRTDNEDANPQSSVSGYVFDPKGFAVEGAEVLVVANGTNPEEATGKSRTVQNVVRNRYRKAITDFRGAYLVEGIEFRGNVQLDVTAPGLMQRDRVQFIVRPGDTLNDLNILMTPGVTAIGTILSASGVPVDDAVIGLLGLYSPGAFSWVGDARFVRADDNGRFLISAERPADAILRIESTQFDTTSFTNIEIDDGLEFELRMQESAELSGAIQWGDGAPAEHLEVALTGSFDFGGRIRDSATAAQMIAISNEDGVFHFADVDPGLNYKIQVYSVNRKPLSPAMEFGVFEPGKARTWSYEINSPIVVRGIVVGEVTGQPLRDVAVSVLKNGVALPSAGVETKRDGSYELRMLAGPGEYHIYPRHRIRNLYEDGYDIGETVQLAAGEETRLNLTLPDTFTMSFLILDVAGNPAHNVNIGIRDERDILEYRAWRPDTDGRWSWSGFRAGADSSISIFSGGRERVSSTAVMGEPGMIVQEEILVLLEYGGIEGVALDAQRIPIANAIIEVSVSNGAGQDKKFRLQTDEYGEFVTLDEIPATTVSLDMRIASRTEQADRPLAWRSEAFGVPADHVVDLGALTFTSGLAMNRQLTAHVSRNDQ